MPSATSQPKSWIVDPTLNPRASNWKQRMGKKVSAAKWAQLEHAAALRIELHAAAAAVEAEATAEEAAKANSSRPHPADAPTSA
jgi:hypothetical protein